MRSAMLRNKLVAGLEGGRRGWPVILSGLKSLLETGKPLPQFGFVAESKKALEQMKKAAQKHAGKGR